MSDHDPKTKKPAARPRKVARVEPSRADRQQASSRERPASKDHPRTSSKAVNPSTNDAEATAVATKSGQVAPGPKARAADTVARSQQSTKRHAKSSAAMKQARFSVGDVVRHRFYPFRGIVFDIDPVFANTEEWWLAIPEEIRPAKDQPFYHLLAENAETEYVAYVSEQNLLADQTGKPLRHPRIAEMFEVDDDGLYRAVFINRH